MLVEGMSIRSVERITGTHRDTIIRLMVRIGKGCEKLGFLTRFYVTDELEYDVELTLAEGEAQSVCLGRPEWSRLGWDTWVFAGDHLGEAKVRFCPEV